VRALSLISRVTQRDAGQIRALRAAASSYVPETWTAISRAAGGGAQTWLTIMEFRLAHRAELVVLGFDEADLRTDPRPSGSHPAAGGGTGGQARASSMAAEQQVHRLWMVLSGAVLVARGQNRWATMTGCADSAFGILNSATCRSGCCRVSYRVSSDG
jgi:hypothetical protein